MLSNHMEYKYEDDANNKYATVVVNMDNWNPRISGWLNRYRYDHEVPIITEFRVSDVLPNSVITPKYILDNLVFDGTGLICVSSQYINSFDEYDPNQFQNVEFNNYTGRVKLDTLFNYDPDTIQPVVMNGFPEFQFINYTLNNDDAIFVMMIE